MSATVYCFQTGQILAPVINLRGGTVNAVPDTAKGTEVARRTESVVIAAWTPAGRPQNFPDGGAAA